jgi:hypothetical protein
LLGERNLLFDPKKISYKKKEFCGKIAPKWPRISFSEIATFRQQVPRGFLGMSASSGIAKQEVQQRTGAYGQ